MGDSPRPVLSVVIVNYRTPALAAACVASIDDPEAEVLVVDNASGDGSVERLRKIGVRVLERSDNDGFAAAVNDGMRHTAGEVVVVLNADAKLRPGALDALVDHLDRHPGVALAAPVLVTPDGEPLLTAYGRFPGAALLFAELCLPLAHAAMRFPALDRYRIRPAQRATERPVAHVQGAAMAVRRSAWSQSGGLDERYFLYLEETEWQARLAKLGWRIDVVPGAEVVHLQRSGGSPAVPSVHYLHSVELYLAQRGVPRAAVVAMVSVAIAVSRTTVRMIALLPRRGAPSRAAVKDWDDLWRAWWPPHRPPA